MIAMLNKNMYSLLSTEVQSSSINEEQINYLIRYGYLENTSTRSPLEIIKAISAFQEFFSLPITGVIDDATSKQMQVFRCGMPDIISNKARFDVSGLGGWDTRQLTYFVTNVTNKLDAERTAYFTKIALDHWGKYGKLSFTRIYDNSAHLVTTFNAKYHMDGYPFESWEIAHAFHPHTKREGQVHYNEDMNWVFLTPKRDIEVDFYSIAVHELGHALGMKHSTVRESVMYPSYSPLDYRKDIHPDDILGITTLYP